VRKFLRLLFNPSLYSSCSQIHQSQSHQFYSVQIDQAARSSINQSSVNPFISELSIIVVETVSILVDVISAHLRDSGELANILNPICLTHAQSSLQVVLPPWATKSPLPSHANIPPTKASSPRARILTPLLCIEVLSPNGRPALERQAPIPNGLVLTEEGFENTFAGNHLGHALLFYLLLDNKCLANDARIVITASGTHDPTQKSGLPDAEYTTAERLARPTSKEDKEIEGRERYANSKLCNILCGYALYPRLDSWPVRD
jgi:hypothetical protein